VAYRLLHAIFTTAEDDRVIRRNPCRIEGAAKEESKDRETILLPTVYAIARAVPVRYRMLVLLATFADLRWGELAGLRRENIDLDACEVRIVETVAEMDEGGLLPETPKSNAGPDGQARALQRPGRADLPARHQGPRPGHRAAPRTARREIGHKPLT